MQGSLNSEKIDIHENYEVEYWATKFGVSAETLKEAVTKAGNSPEAVKRFFEH